MVEVGEDTWGSAWPKMYEALGGNPWAAMPSLHFATSLVAALSLAEAGKVEGALGWSYAGDARLRPRLPRRALRHRPARRGGAGGRGQARRAAGRAARARRQARRCAAWSASRAGSVQGVSGDDSANGNGAVEMPLLHDAAPGADGRASSCCCWSASTSSSRSWSASATRWASSTTPTRSGSRSRSASTSLAYATYIALFKAVVGGDALRLSWLETYEINMAGVAATLLFSAGGAGGIALTYWALRKAGMRRRDVARRMVAFVTLHYAFYPLALIVFGVLLRTGVLNGKDSVELTIIPAGVAGLLIVIGVLIALIPPDLERRLRPLRPRRARQGLPQERRQSAGDGGGGVPLRARPLRPSLARRAGGARRRRLLGGQHRRALGLLPRLRRPRAAGGRRPGLLPRHGRQPLPAGAGRGRRGRRRHDRRLRPLRHPRGDRLPGDPRLPPGRLLDADPARHRRLLPAAQDGPPLGSGGAADRTRRQRRIGPRAGDRQALRRRRSRDYYKK